MADKEIQELHLAHKSAKKSRNVSDAYRINAIILLGSGWTLEEVANALLLDDETLRNYVRLYKEGGLEQLIERHYKGGKPKLPMEYLEALSQELDSNIYLTTQSICVYVKDQFNLEYTISGMTALLHRMGYVYKKPKLVPANADKDAQERFVAQYLEFMKNKKENEAIFFVDAIHPTHNTMAAYGWIRKGKERQIKSNSGRSRLNIHGAMNADTFETTVIVSEENVNADSTIALFQSLENIYPLALVLYLIVDNAKYHFSPPVLEYLKNSRIKLIPLPTYSSELNLIERLWKVFKKNVFYNKYYETFPEFKKSCIEFFRNQERYFDEIQSIMDVGLEALA